MGAPPNEDQMADMLSNPAIAQTMNEALNNPDFVNYMIQSNPMLASMPNAREMLQSPAFRSMMTNPESLRMASRLRRVMGGGQGATPAFPAPGATDTTPADAAASDAAGAGGAGAQAANPFGAFPPGLFGAPGGAGFGDFGGAGAGANPFAALFNPMAAQAADPSRQTASSQNAGSQGSGTTGATSTGITTPSTTTQTGATPSTGSTSPPATGTGTDAAAAAAANPFAALFGPGFGAPGAQGGANPYGMPAMTPEQLQQVMQLMGMGGGTGMGGGMGAFGVPPAAPPDNRPPEERYAGQLRQLNDMGFFDFDRNVSALRRSGGNVEGAVEYLLSNVD
jgi:ubiquilin